MSTSRPPAVAGLFYPSEADDLSSLVRALLRAAPAAEAAPPKALIVPHAGYVYSGSTAAVAYRLLAPAREQIRRVVLIGPAHRLAVDGLALPGAEEMTTPLGAVPVARIPALPHVIDSAASHRDEHSVEVQLPFLSTVLADFEVVPLVVGHAATSEVADVLEALWGGTETVIVVSSDLSHYHPYEEANAVDAGTIDQILDLDGELTHGQACGATPVNGLMEVMRRRGGSLDLVAHCNSGDTCGDMNRVVGYASFRSKEELVDAGAS